MKNLLKKEKSPYLKQHENNPVHWYAWGKKALDKAKELKKPIFLSVGYASCHWCHVMAHESFEDIKTASVLNEKFIDYPKNKVLYKGSKKLYKYNGKGFTYGNRLENIDVNREKIEKRIKNKEFDFIIYGRVGNKDGSVQQFKDLINWKHVNKHYNKNNIVFIYGGDKTRSKDDECLKMHSEKGICFVRELS